MKKKQFKFYRSPEEEYYEREEMIIGWIAILFFPAFIIALSLYVIFLQ